jgi:hypothetical protein
MAVCSQPEMMSLEQQEAVRMAARAKARKRLARKKLKKLKKAQAVRMV